MKNRLLMLLGAFLSGSTMLFAQIGFNSPAGITPTGDVEVYSRNTFLVQQKYQYVDANPNASITNLTCNGPTLTASAGIMKDPGGDFNYSDPQSTTCTQTIQPTMIPDGIEFVFEDIETEFAVDYVVIRDTYGREQRFFGTFLPKRFLISGFAATIKFVTNGNGTAGRGFRLRWRSLKRDNSSASSALLGFGSSLEFNIFNASLQAGNANQAKGRGSVALGASNTADGNYSAALGAGNDTPGDYGIALGLNNVASGDYSSALGNYVSTNNYRGAFIIGDYSTGSTLTVSSATAQNQFTARFAGGYRLFSNSATTLGVQMASGGNAWSSISDSAKKERFLPLNHAELLGKIRLLRLGTWNYKGQREQRHYGPMAQDFFARFGHDALGEIGCDTLINSHDFTAITLSGVQALVLENEQLKARLTQAEARLEALERAVLVRPALHTSHLNRRKRP